MDSKHRLNVLPTVTTVCLALLTGCQYSETTISTDDPVVTTTRIAQESNTASGDVVPTAATQREASPESRELLVLELFTSEGCSSCPPADRLLREIYEGRNQVEKEVLVLSWHVDYWDYLGWKDPFSLPEASSRQRRYAPRLKTGVFTPQLVVNGIQSAVGSRSADVATALKNGRRSDRSSVSVSVERNGADSCRVTVEYGGAIAGAVVLVGVLQKSAVVEVAAGENSGRTLDHVNIVRSVQHRKTESTEGQLAFDIPIPEGLRADNGSIFTLLQSEGSGTILGAAVVPLAP